MQKKLIMLLALVLPIAIFSQTESKSKYFVQLNSGNLIDANQIELYQSYFATSFLLVNQRDTFRINETKAYQYQYGYFKKFRNTESGQFQWYKRDITGKINTYHRLVSNYYGGNGYVTSESAPMRGYSTTQKNNYFQIGEETPRKFEYGALLDLMHDNNSALALLKKGRQKMRIKNTVLILGATVFTVGVVSTIIRHSKVTTSLDEYTISPLGLIGGVVVGISLLMPNDTRNYKKAIVLYNQ